MTSKHSITSMDINMNSNTIALQNIKQRIWQAVNIEKGSISSTKQRQCRTAFP